MKKSVNCFFVLFMCVGLHNAKAQVNGTETPRAYKLPKLDAHSYIRDSTGKRYDYTAWSSMVATGRYGVKVATLPNEEKPSLIVGRLTKQERDEAMAKLPKPAESPYFKTGEPLKPFKETDVNGQPVELKQLAGKIVVLNFWYINNPLCRRQIPDLNELAAAYKTDTDVVFLAFAMDDKEAILDFIKYNPYDYRHIDKGKGLTSKLNIKMHPTDLVIDKAGNIKYHSTGYSPANYYWIAKTIEQIKSGQN